MLGAGGAVGGAILRVLQAYPGLQAVPVLRRLALLDAETRVADTADSAALEAALEGCSLVVNAVGGPHTTLTASTVAVCAASRRAGVRRLVHISSMAVHGSRIAGNVAEDAAFATDPSPYEAAKIASEHVMRAHMAAGHEAVILRPGLVFGPHSAQWAHRIARLLRAGRLGDLGPAGDGLCNLTHEADLGAATMAAFLTQGAANLAVNVAAPDPPTWNVFLTMFARALGATPVRRIGPRRLGWERRAAPLLQIARRGMGGRVPDAVPFSLQCLFAQRMRLDPTLADRVLAFPRTPDPTGIAATGARLRG